MNLNVVKLRSAIAIVSAFTVVSSCTPLVEKMPNMTPADFAELSDKEMCLLALYEESEGVQSFQNDLSKRGLNRNQCCYQRIERRPLFCYGYITPKGRFNEPSIPPDRVELIFAEDGVSRQFEEIGQLVDIWENSVRVSSATRTEAEITSEAFRKLLSPEDGQVKLNREFVESRFNTLYQGRAAEIGADALILVIAEEGPYSHSMPLNSYADPLGQVYTTRIESSGDRTRLVFRAVKFVE